MNSSERHNSSPGHNRDRGACPAPEELSAFFDGELDGSPDASFDHHVSSCDACRNDLRDFLTLRAALKATSPAVAARSFVVTEAAPVNRSGTILREADRIRPFPVFPVLTAIAAVLIIALIAGELLSGNGEPPPPAENTANGVLVIEGTPFGPGANDAEFGAASADDMNDGQPGETSAGETESDSDFLTGWRIAQILASAGLVIVGGLWYVDRRRHPAPA